MKSVLRQIRGGGAPRSVKWVVALIASVLALVTGTAASLSATTGPVEAQSRVPAPPAREQATIAEMLATPSEGDENWDNRFELSGMSARTCAVQIAGNGDVYAGGEFTTAGGVVVNRIARWDGTSWHALGSGMICCSVDAIATAANGDVYAGGNFTTAGGVPADRIARWDGTSWHALGSGISARFSWVFALAIAAIAGNGDVYAGGFFTTAGGVPARYIARWDGTSWHAMDSGLRDRANALAIAANGDVYAGGFFTEAGGKPANHIARWDGTSWHDVGDGIYGYTVDAIAIAGNGDVYAGGEFTMAGGVPANNIARWDGTSWHALGSGIGGETYSSVSALAIAGNGDVFVGGGFTTAGAKPSSNIALWHPTIQQTPTATPTLTPTSTNTPTATPTACALTFTDVNPPDYFYEAVIYLACHGVISGYSDGTFRPYNDTTRGQLSKIVVLAREWPIVTPTSTPTFRDVPIDNPFYAYIETAYSQGVVSGYSCGTGCLEFRPFNNITRGQLTKVVVLATNWEITPPQQPTFQDVPLDHPFYAYIETAYAHRIISGYSCGVGCLEFRPGNNATRGQISKIVYNAVTGP